MMWAIYYADNSVYSHLDGLPEDSPKDFVVAISQETEPFGRTVLTGDFFIFRDGRWSHHDLHGVIEQFKHHAKDIQAMRNGYYADDRTFHQIAERARTGG